MLWFSVTLEPAVMNCVPIRLEVYGLQVDEQASLSECQALSHSVSFIRRSDKGLIISLIGET